MSSDFPFCARWVGKPLFGIVPCTLKTSMSNRKEYIIDNQIQNLNVKYIYLGQFEKVLKIKENE